MPAMKKTFFKTIAAVSCCLLLCGANAGKAKQSGATSHPPAKQSAAVIPESLFGMSVLDAEDYPAVKVGTLGHPPLTWSRLETAKGVFAWQVSDRAVDLARAHGLVDSDGVANMVFTLAGTPSWAVTDQRHCKQSFRLVHCSSAPDHIEDWREFITALVHRYNGKTAPHIKYYELWNEATAPNFWTGSPEDMVRLAAVAYPIIHSDPYSLLLTPSAVGPSTTPESRALAWMASYLQAGGSKYADGGTFHGYLAMNKVTPYPMPEQDETAGCGSTPPNICAGSILTLVRNYRRVFDENGLAGKPMFNSEGSWGLDTIPDPDMQIAWLARYYLLQAGLAAENNLQLISWWAWGRPRGERHPWGSIETATGNPTAAGLAYNQLHDWIVGATISPCSLKGSVWTCTLSRPGGYEAQAVWEISRDCNNGTCGTVPYSYSSDRRFTHYKNLSGEKIKIKMGDPTIPIGAKPILLENR